MCPVNMNVLFLIYTFVSLLLDFVVSVEIIKVELHCPCVSDVHVHVICTSFTAYPSHLTVIYLSTNWSIYGLQGP